MIPVSFSLFLYFSLFLLLLLLLFYVIIYFYKNFIIIIIILFIYFFLKIILFFHVQVCSGMFRHVPECSMFLVLSTAPQTSCGVCFCSSRIHFSPHEQNKPHRTSAGRLLLTFLSLDFKGASGKFEVEYCGLDYKISAGI